MRSNVGDETFKKEVDQTRALSVQGQSARVGDASVLVTCWFDGNSVLTPTHRSVTPVGALTELSDLVHTLYKL